MRQAGVEPPIVEIEEESTAAPMLPGAGDRRQAGHGVHRRRAVARAREAEADPEEAAPGATVEPREALDLGDRKPGDGGGPTRRLVGEVGLDLGAEVGVTREVIAVAETLLQQQVHHGQRQRAVGAGPQHETDIGRLDSGRAIDVDDHQRGAALLARLGDVGHGVDLGRDGIAAPHDDEIRLGHLARIRP